MVGHQRVDGAVSQGGAQRFAVALLAQRWRQAGAAVEVAQIHVDQVQVVDAHIAGHGQALGLGLAHQLNASGAADAAQVDAGTGAAHQLEDGVQRNQLGGHRNARQAHACGQRPAGGHALAQPCILRTQPHGVAESARILQRTLQHLGIDDGHLGLAEADAAGLGQLDHLGQHFALEATGERTQRKHPCLVQFARTVLEHVHQAGFVQHGVGVGQTDQAGDPAGHRRRQLRGQHASMLLAGLAQAHRQIDQAGGHDAAAGIDGAGGHKAAAGLTQTGFHGDDAACGHGHVAEFVAARGGVDDPATADEDFHG